MTKDVASARAIDFGLVWATAAANLRAHVAAGRQRLLTEDTVRMSTILGLEQSGIVPARMAVEVVAEELNGGKLDLVVDGSNLVVVEIKFPRDSRTGISPDTMTLGEMLRDFPPCCCGLRRRSLGRAGRQQQVGEVPSRGS